MAHIALPVAVVFLVAAVVIGAALRLARARRPGGQMVTIAVGPRVDRNGGEVFWRHVHPMLRRRRPMGSRPHVVFELTGSAEGLRLGLWVPAGVSAVAVARAVESAWPGARARVGPAGPVLAAGSLVAGGDARLGSPEWFPLAVDHAVDPLRTVLGALGGGYDGTAGVVQVLARPARSRRLARCRRAALSLRAGRPTSGVVRVLDAGRSHPASPMSGDLLRSGDVRAMVAKSADVPGWEVLVRYGTAMPHGVRGARRVLRGRAGDLAAGFGVYAGRNHLRARRRARLARYLDGRAMGGGDLMGTSELAALAHLPTDTTVAGLARAEAASVAPPPGVLAGWQDDESDDDEDDMAGTL